MKLRCAAQVFEDGAMYDPKVLDIKDEDLMDSVMTAITRIAAASLELGYPTLASIPHSVINGYKNVLAISVATDYDFPLAEKVPALSAMLHLGSSAHLDNDPAKLQQCGSLIGTHHYSDPELLFCHQSQFSSQVKMAVKRGFACKACKLFLVRFA